jgi:hypothetical protein
MDGWVNHWTGQLILHILDILQNAPMKSEYGLSIHDIVKFAGVIMALVI